MAVVDGDQLDEADQLAGTARLLLGGEGRGGEAVERARNLLASGREAALVAAQGGAGEPVERGVRLRAGGPPARLLVLRREDLPEPGGHRRGLGPARVELVLRRVVGGRQVVGEAGLVRVEQVLLHAQQRRPAARAPAGELAHGEGGVDAGAREARGLAELAQQQPGRPRCGRPRPGSPRPSRRSCRAAALRAAGRGRPRAASRHARARTPRRRRARSAPRGRPPGADRRRPCASGPRSWARARSDQPQRRARLVEQQRRLGVEDEVLHALRGLPRGAREMVRLRRRRRGGNRREAAISPTENDEAARHRG